MVIPKKQTEKPSVMHDIYWSIQCDIQIHESCPVFVPWELFTYEYAEILIAIYTSGNVVCAFIRGMEHVLTMNVYSCLTHLPLDKMAIISQMVFWDAFT